MVQAAKKANMELVRLMTLYAHQKTVDYGLTAAVSSGSHSMVHLLLEKGASIEASIDPRHPTDISHLWVYDDPIFRECVTTLLAEAIRASDNELIRYFEKKGALAKVNDGRGMHLEAALHAVSEVGDMPYLLKLLQLVPKPDPYVSSPALCSAIKAKSDDITLALLAVGADVLPLFDTAIREAVRSGSKRIISAILETVILEGSYEAREVLSDTVQRGDMSIVKDLVFLGVDINFNKNVIEGRPSLNPGDRGPSPLAAAVLIGDFNLVEYLLKHGADPANSEAFKNAFTQNGEVLGVLFGKFRQRYPEGLPRFGAGVLHFALQTSNVVLLNLCLDAKFDINSSENTAEDCEMTALGFLISKHRGTRLDLVSKLLDAGADVNAIARRELYHDRYEPSGTATQTALLQAIETKSLPLVTLLVHRGADTQKAARLRLRRTPLQEACEVGSYPIVRLLLDCHADVNSEPPVRGGGTALQMAAKSGSGSIVKLLLENGASVHAPPSQLYGHSAIDYAAKYGRLDIIEVLCNVWDQPLTAEQYKRAIAMAQKYGHSACVLLLRRLSYTFNGLFTFLNDFRLEARDGGGWDG